MSELKNIGKMQFGNHCHTNHESWGSQTFICNPRMVEFCECITCETRYPVIDGVARCNGASITECPFCPRAVERIEFWNFVEGANFGITSSIENQYPYPYTTIFKNSKTGKIVGKIVDYTQESSVYFLTQ